MEWIDVKDRLPDKTNSQHCLVCTDWGGVATAWYGLFSVPPTHKKAKYEFRVYPQFSTVVDIYNSRSYKITHWMPLPEPPKNKSNYNGHTK